MENPFDPENPFVPFAGREDAFTLLQNHLNNPGGTDAAVYLGRRRIGKTALLKQTYRSFDENHLIIDLTPGKMAINDEHVWLTSLAQALIDTTEAHGFYLPEPPVIPTESVREWLRDVCLPELLHLIRRQRRFVILFDDAHHLIDAVRADRLPADHFAYLDSLLRPQVGMALTICDSHEDRLDTLAPLAHPVGVMRLSYLPYSATAHLLKRYTPFGMDDATLTVIHEATGGDPTLLQRFGYHLCAGDNVSQARLKVVTNTVYAEADSAMRQQWRSLSRDEQLLLTALSSLYYDDPLRPVDTALIEKWLVETDYPMDMTAINAVFRSLEYREIITGKTADIRMCAGLMRRWIMEHARIVSPVNPPEGVSRRTWLIAAVLVVLFVALVLAISSSSGGGGGVDDIPPTVTLSAGGS